MNNSNNLSGFKKEVKSKLKHHNYLVFSFNKLNCFYFVILIFVTNNFLGCTDSKYETLPATSSEFLVNSMYGNLSKEDSLSILRYYSRHEAFPDVVEKSKKVTLREALAEQKAYEEIAFSARAGGRGVNAANFEPTPYFAVYLRNNYLFGKKVVGLNGTLEVIDEFNEVLMTEKVRVDHSSDDKYGELPVLWLPMAPETEKIISKINYETLGVCFKAGLKLKFSDQSINTVNFPLCYKGYENWKRQLETS